MIENDEPGEQKIQLIVKVSWKIWFAGLLACGELFTGPTVPTNVNGEKSDAALTFRDDEVYQHQHNNDKHGNPRALQHMREHFSLCLCFTSICN